MLPTSHQPLSVDHFKPRCVQNRVLGRKCPNMVFRLQAPQNCKFWFFHIHRKRLNNTLPTSHQPLPGDHFKPRYVQKRVLDPKCLNMVIRPQAPQNLNTLKMFTFTRSYLLICFQQAINHYLGIILSQDISKNVFWAQNAQIWLFGPRPIKIWKFWFFSRWLEET